MASSPLILCVPMFNRQPASQSVWQGEQRPVTLTLLRRSLRLSQFFFLRTFVWFVFTLRAIFNSSNLPRSEIVLQAHSVLCSGAVRILSLLCNKRRINITGFFSSRSLFLSVWIFTSLTFLELYRMLSACRERKKSFKCKQSCFIKYHVTEEAKISWEIGIKL